MRQDALKASDNLGQASGDHEKRDQHDRANG